MTRVALLWHMHQPFYKDLVTGDHLLPWVRLHALKDYFGMAAVLREFPDVRVTFNLVPSLLTQIEAFAADEARDPYLEASLKPAEQLTEHDVEFILAHFFHANRQHLIDPYPRYAELLRRRGERPSMEVPSREAADEFSMDDLRDLQVWHKLAWLDPEYLERDPRVRLLLDKGRQFTEADKGELRTIELEILNAVIPAYRAAADRGQVELSTSPFYHPILPLLCDTEVYRRTHPDAARPGHRFVHPEDALEQLTRATDYHQRLFGRRPMGVWPSEGSVSDAMVPLVGRAGFTWMATDEAILARSLETALARDGHGVLDHPEILYRPYAVEVDGTRVACVFRDHMLSDLIGFTYASWPAEAAAEDFVHRLVQAGRRFSERSGGEEAVISIVLDGENAWEHFEGGGRPFLRALYSRLSNHTELATVTMDEACRQTTRTLSSIFPGSWIDANFYVWIGHRDDQKAWTQLAEARTALDAVTGVPPDAVAQAREEILIAEGSDWFWWYGDDRSSDHDAEFDDLFRRHLRNVYRLLGMPVPDALLVSNISTGQLAHAGTEPLALLTPIIDGEETSYFEWLGAGRFEVREVAGAMHHTSRRQPVLTTILFAFDRERLYLRLDTNVPPLRILADGYELCLEFLKPAGVRFSLRATSGGVAGTFWDRLGDPPAWRQRNTTQSTVAAGSVTELSVPLAELGPPEGPMDLLLFITVRDADGAETEQHPAQQPISLNARDSRFESLHWRV